MPSFIYSPEVRVHVSADGTNIPEFSNNIYDISEDLVQGSLIIRTNGVHTFNFQLQNTQRKYDGVFQPMDRITVEMKRITWVRVFSGYLNNGPVFSAWPRVLNMSASCTLKRLQFWYWDPTSQASFELLSAALGSGGHNPTTGTGANGSGATQQSPIGGQAPAVGAGRDAIRVAASGGGTLEDQFWETYYKANPGSRPLTPPVNPGEKPANPSTDTTPDAKKDPADATGQQKFDDSIKGVVLKILDGVVGWPQSKVHIGAIPPSWIDLASDVGNTILKAADVKDLLGDFSQGDQTTPGIDTSNPNGPVPPGTVLDWCKAGCQLANLPLAYADGLAKQAMFESSGNPKAVQHGVDDINSRNGNPAKGLMQMIPSTFMAWAVPGHTDIFNPIDSAASAGRYALNKYGPGWFSGPHTSGY